MKLRITIVPLLMGASLALTACPDNGGSADGGVNPPPPPPGDASMDASAEDARTNPDATVRPDAMPRMDAMPLPDSGYQYGTRLASLNAGPAQTVQMTDDEMSLFYIQTNGTEARLWQAPLAGGAPVDRGPSPEQWYPGSRGDNLWTVYDLPSRPTTPGTGNLRVVKVAGTGTAATVLPQVLQGELFISPNNNHVVAYANLGRIGTGATATLTADLVVARGDGMPRQSIRSGMHAGRWVPPSQTSGGGYAGVCGTAGAWVSDTVAFLVGCLDPATEVASIVRVDAAANTVSASLADNVIPFVIGGGDGSYALFVDSEVKLHAVDAAGTMAIPVAETEPITQLAILDGKRFLYLTEGGLLKVASWPTLQPTLISMGIIAIDQTSDDRHFVMVERTAHPTQQGLSDLFLARTTTSPVEAPVQVSEAVQSYPGDETFSADSQYVYWYDDVDSSFIGTIKGRKTDGTGNAVELAPTAYFVLNYGDPNAVLLFVNASAGAGGVALDLAIRKRDASTPFQILVPGIDVNDFIISPTTKNKFVYQIATGARAGLYVRDLPAAQ